MADIAECPAVVEEVAKLLDAAGLDWVLAVGWMINTDPTGEFGEGHIFTAGRNTKHGMHPDCFMDELRDWIDNGWEYYVDEQFGESDI